MYINVKKLMMQLFACLIFNVDNNYCLPLEIQRTTPNFYPKVKSLLNINAVLMVLIYMASLSFRCS